MFLVLLGYLFTAAHLLQLSLNFGISCTKINMAIYKTRTNMAARFYIRYWVHIAESENVEH